MRVTVFVVGFCFVFGCAGQRPPDSETVAPEKRSSPSRADFGISPTLDRGVERADLALLNGPSRERLANHLKTLTARPHHAGSAADLTTAQYVHQQFLSFGLESRIDEYEVLLPYPEESMVEMLRPTAFRAAVKEQAIDEDFDTHSGSALPPALVFSPDGEALGRAIYVNFGQREDFAKLKELGVDLKKSVAIARYGKMYRGNKVKNAADAGCSAIVIYSDPAEDGFARGDVYPKGPWRPATAIERGSILDIALFPGDPLTPGIAAVAGAHRRDTDELATIPSIPAVALSYSDARPILEALDGATVPIGWQGGLGITYHLGGTDKTILRVKTQSEWKLRKIWNVIATLKGAIDPTLAVHVGSHRDAWVFGAVDPCSGTAVLLETAKNLAALAASGERPARSITFCSFDGEEFGLMGSVEFYEDRRKELGENTFLYINCDAAVSGGKLEANYPGELGPLVAAALRVVPDERTAGQSLFDTGNFQPSALLGGGSDHVPYVHGLNIPSMSLTTSGSYGVYHSLYDTFGWMKRHGDPEFHHHLRLTRALSILLHRAASVTLLPYDFEALGARVRDELHRLSPLAPTFDISPLDLALDDLLVAARELALARRKTSESDPDPLRMVPINRAQSFAFRLFLREKGLPGRAFYKNLLVGVDTESGYAAEPLPALRAALRTADPASVDAASADLAAALKAFTDRLRGITAALDRGS